MTSRQLEILQHTLGADQYGRRQRYSDRNYYIGEDATANDLAALGMMVKYPGNCATGREPCYRSNDAGIKAMREASPAPPNLTRSQVRFQEYRNCNDAFGWTFREFLANIQTDWYREMKASG